MFIKVENKINCAIKNQGGKMFTTIENPMTTEIVEKKSRFIANVYYVESREEAEEKIKELKKKYFDARHNCSAYRVLERKGDLDKTNTDIKMLSNFEERQNTIIEKSSDDGEPSGTAGAPMLNILQKNNLCNILVVVTRYFGGILLGTGGLVRAYSEATLKAIENSNKVNICIGKEFEISVDYSNLENFKYYCRKNGINIIKTEYLNEIVCNIEIENENIDDFLKDIEKRTINILKYREIQERYIRKNAEEK